MLERFCIEMVKLSRLSLRGQQLSLQLSFTLLLISSHERLCPPPPSTEALSTIIRFQAKTELFCSVFKKICVHTYRFWIIFTRPHYNADEERNHIAKMADRCYLCDIGSICPPLWIPMVEWSGARSCLLWWRLRFQIVSFSPSALESSVFKKHRFKIAPLWTAFWNGSVFGDRFRRCSVDDGRIRSKTDPFSFENGLVWTGPEQAPHRIVLFW